MFKKRRCYNCGNKVNGNYDFCPYCGTPLHKNKKEDWGLLGKKDLGSDFDAFDAFNKMNFYPGMNTIFNSLLKNLTKQLKDLNIENDKGKNLPEQKDKRIKKGISIHISTFGNNPPKIILNSIGDKNLIPQHSLEKKGKLPRGISKEKIRKISELPKEEPQTNIRRLGDRVIYEINLPGVKSVDDILITKLESSIEIKALAKNKSYSKLIPINLHIMDYNFSKEKLILELGEEN